MQIPRHWQSPITWRARNVTYFVVVVVSLTLFVAGLAYPERQPWISVVTLSLLVLPVSLRLRFVLLVRGMKAVPADKEVMRFPFYTCDKLDEDANRSQLEARAGWAELADDSLTLWVANGRLPYRQKEKGAPLAVSVMSPHKSLYDQLVVETTKGKLSFQIIRKSGTGAELAGSRAIADLAEEARKYLGASS